MITTPNDRLESPFLKENLEITEAPRIIVTTSMNKGSNSANRIGMRNCSCDKTYEPAPCDCKDLGCKYEPTQN